MKLQIASSLMFAAVLTLATAPAQAFSGFGFTTDYSPKPADPKKDIMLESVTYGGKTYSNFGLVTGANILTNGLITGIQRGPGSSDRGDDASGIAVENPTNADVVASLGNLNLNNIIDTEDDKGTSVIEVSFAKAARTFYFFERGMNSDLKVEGLDDAGNVISDYTITRADFQGNFTGYSLDTTEIEGRQKVGSYGLSLDRDIKTLRLSSFNGFNGPDYKVVAKVPEPATLAGLGMVAGIAALARRKKNQASESVQ